MLQVYINEFEGFFPNEMFSETEQIKYWALFATTYYEKLFYPINDFETLKETYTNKFKTIENNDAKMALYYFYKYREKQLIDDLQNGINENQQQNTILTPGRIKYYEQVITDSYALTVLDTVKNNNGKCSERQYRILSLAVSGNLKPSTFGSKN